MEYRPETTVGPTNKRSVKELLKRRRVWLLVGSGLLLALLAGVGYIIYDAAEMRRLDAESVGLVEELKVGYGEEVRISDFLARLDGELVDNTVVKTDELGEQQVGFEYINVRGRKRPYNFTVKVVDKVAPVIYGLPSYTVEKGYDGNLTDLMLSGDDLDDEPVREIAGEYDLGKVGTYDLEYVIRDAGGNETRQAFQLKVVEPVKSAGGASTVATRPKQDFAQVQADYKNERTKVGIDVSSWQGEIDWVKVKKAGAEFAFIRLGYQVGYGGEYVVDKFFERNIQEAFKAGLPVGVYFYSYANNIEEAKKQAAWVAEQIRGYEIELGVAFDWEDWKNFNQAGMSFRTINRVAQEFLAELAKEGYKGWLYGSKNYLEKIWQPGKTSVWLAQYHDKVTYVGEYGIWQLCDTGRIEGIQGDVDIDVWYF